MHSDILLNTETIGEGSIHKTEFTHPLPKEVLLTARGRNFCCEYHCSFRLMSISVLS